MEKPADKNLFIMSEDSVILRTPFQHSGLTSLYYDLKCPFLCENDIVVDPVVLECGHIFCYDCITTNIERVNN